MAYNGDGMPIDMGAYGYSRGAEEHEEWDYEEVDPQKQDTEEEASVAAQRKEQAEMAAEAAERSDQTEEDGDGDVDEAADWMVLPEARRSSCNTRLQQRRASNLDWVREGRWEASVREGTSVSSQPAIIPYPKATRNSPPLPVPYKDRAQARNATSRAPHLSLGASPPFTVCAHSLFEVLGVEGGKRGGDGAGEGGREWGGGRERAE